MPRASSSISSESPSQPGKPRWALPGSRSVAAGRRRAGAASGTTSMHPADQVVAQRATRAACSACCLTASSTAAANAGDRRGVDGAAADVALLAAAVHAAAVTSTSRRTTSAPTPYGPPTLCPVSVSASTPDAAKSTGTAPTAWTASVCTGMPCAAAIATTSAIGWRVPTSLLAHITEISATESGSRSTARAQRVDVEPAALVDRQQLDLGALVLGEPVERVEHGVVLDRAWPGSASGAGRRRAATSRCP